MADVKALEKEAFLFAEDLFSDLMCLHPMFRAYLPEHCPTPRKSVHFTHAISKSVMIVWHELRNALKAKYRKEFNAFSKGDAALKKYLEHLCGTVRKTSDCKFTQVLELSAVLLELIAMLYRRGYTYFLYSAPIYWLFMFKIIAGDELYKEEIWEGVALLSKVHEVKYDSSVDEIYWQYWALDVTTSDQNSENRSTHSAEKSSGIVTDFAPDSIITEKAGLKTISKVNVVSDFKGGEPSSDTYVPKTSKTVRNRPSKEMSPKDGKALDSKEKGCKTISSEGKDALSAKRSSKYASPKNKGSSKKSTILDTESSMSKGSSASTEKKHINPLGTTPGTSKYTPPGKTRVHKTKSEDTFSKSFEKSCGPVKKDFVTVRTKVPKTEDIPTTLPNLEDEACTDTTLSEEKIPTEEGPEAGAIPGQKESQDIPATESGAIFGQKESQDIPATEAGAIPGQKESQDIPATEAGDSNRSPKERSSQKSASKKQNSSKKVPKDTKPRARWR